MKRFFIYLESSNSGEEVKRQLIYRGINSNNIHILIKSKYLVEDIKKSSIMRVLHNLNFIKALKQGCFIGIFLTLLGLVTTCFIGFHYKVIIIIGLIIFGIVFGIWVGSFIKIHLNNRLYKEVKRQINKGKKVLVVLYNDLTEKKLINEVINCFPDAEASKIIE